MPDQEDHRWQWDAFVQIGNTIQTMHRLIRSLQAKLALDFAELLVENEFIPTLPLKDQHLFKDLLPKLAVYLDGRSIAIESTIRDYFLCEHAMADRDYYLFDVSFAPKNSGRHIGLTCDVKNGSQTVRYFVKTHHYRATLLSRWRWNSDVKCIEPPDTKELFVYKILHLIGMGPQAHFAIPLKGAKRTVHVATMDCHLISLSNLIKYTACDDALLHLDLIARILCLCDCATNCLNCGRVGERAMIVDFRIEKRNGGYFQADIRDKFCDLNSDFHVSKEMPATVKKPQVSNLDSLKKSLQDWRLLENIERAERDVEALVQKWSHKMSIKGDLQRYVQDIKATIEVLMKL
jgi:hypothetical protein